MCYIITNHVGRDTGFRFHLSKPNNAIGMFLDEVNGEPKRSQENNENVVCKLIRQRGN